MKTAHQNISLQALIERYALQPVADQVLALQKQAVRLEAAAPDASTALGSSRLGGAPDLSSGVAWPTWHDIPMSFIAQIRLADLAGLEPAQILPKSGLLSFFYDARQETYGALPQDRGGWQVLLFPEGADLQPASFPEALPVGARFTACPLRFEIEWTLPASPAQAIPGLKWSNGRVKAYEALLEDFQHAQDNDGPHHRMFGWPDQLQDDMQLQAALLSQGITQANDPRSRQAERDKRHWQLLLQVDSDDKTGMRWGSNGLIDYWMTDQALQTKRFDQTWLVLQSE